MLLERLGPNLADLDLTVAEILEVITTTLRSFWRPVGLDEGLRTGPDHARWLSRSIVDTRDDLGQPCERSVVDRAPECCDRRIDGFDPTKAVLVHGDAHGWNTLDAGGGIYKFVDVEGLCSEREHDLSVAMREYNEPLINGDTGRLERDRAESLAESCSVDPQPSGNGDSSSGSRPDSRMCATSTTTTVRCSSKSPDDVCETPASCAGRLCRLCASLGHAGRGQRKVFVEEHQIGPGVSAARQ